MRSKVLCFLLSLSLMFCVGFGSSITASAAEVSPDAVNEWFLLPFNELGDIVGTFDETQGTFYATGSGSNRYPQFEVGVNYSSVLPLLLNGHTYLIYGTLSLASNNSTSVPSSISLYEYIGDPTQLYMWSNDALDKHVDYNRSTYSVSGIYSFTMSENIFLNTGGALVWEQTEVIDYNGRCSWAFYALDITNTSEDEVNSIISAINNQTSQLGGKIDNAVYDIQQSIQDQFGGDPGSSFPVDDIITQHNEKMGVLSFGSDTLMQVLGLLSPDQSLSSELVFPSMSLTIAGQRNKVQLWPEYRFDLDELKQHWPNFVGLMQSLTTALVWIFVLRYCYRVFEKYFLAGGGN